MQPRIYRTVLLTLAVFFALVLSACRAGSGHGSDRNDPASEITLQELCPEPVRGQFSMKASGTDLHVLFPERDTLSLKLVVLSPQSGYRLQDGNVVYHDRISDTPDVDASFGEHFYHAGKGGQDLYFYGRQSETGKVLKHMSRPAGEDSWWIELIPAAGRITAVLERDRVLDLFVNAEDALLVLQPSQEESPRIVIEPFRAVETARVLAGDAASGFTVYDEISDRLYRIRVQENAYYAQPLISGGAVHYASLGDDGRLFILAYDRQSCELLFFEEDVQGRFNKTAVTLCRGTTSVYFFSIGGRRMFVYNEITLDRKQNTVHRLSLLYPDGVEKYRKKVLFEDEGPVYRFQAALVNGCLIVSFLQESLFLLTACFPDGASVQNQDL